jgi:hypothetical protein
MEILYYLGKGLGWLLLYGALAVAIISGIILTFALIIYSTRYVIWKLILGKETSTEFLNRLAIEKGYKSYQAMRDIWENKFGSHFEWTYYTATEESLEPYLEEDRRDGKYDKMYDNLYDIYRQHRHTYNNPWMYRWYILTDYKLTANKEWKYEAFIVAATTFIISMAAYMIAALTYYSEHGHKMH